MPSHITYLRQLVEVNGDDQAALRQASKVTTTLIDVVQDMLAQRWSTPILIPSNDFDTDATPFTVFDDPFILPPGTSARKTTPFHSSKAPQISLRDYVTRLFKYMKCSVESYVIALILLERYHLAAGFAVEPMNAFRLYLIALGISAKIRDDKFYSNKYYAEVGGITVAEYTALEIKFLFCIKWATHVDLSEYEACERSILYAIYAKTAIPAVYNILTGAASPFCRPADHVCESPAASPAAASPTQPSPSCYGCPAFYYSQDPLRFVPSQQSLASSVGHSDGIECKILSPSKAAQFPQTYAGAGDSVQASLHVVNNHPNQPQHYDGL